MQIRNRKTEIRDEIQNSKGVAYDEVRSPEGVFSEIGFVVWSWI